MIVAGIGMKRGASSDDILGAIDAALAKCKKIRGELHAIATLEEKTTETGLATAAAHLGLPVIARDLESIKRFAHMAQTESRKSMAVKGVPSVAETAALAAIDAHARLLTPRVINGAATCAIATDDSEHLREGTAL